MLKYLLLIPALFFALALALPSHAQDAEAGKTVYKKCVACHAIGADAKNKVGPILNDLIGRTAGSFEGYKYGKDLVAAGENGLVWTEELVADYIADPRGFLRTYLDDTSAKAKMTFKLKGEQDRLDVVAYLAALSAPAAKEAEVEAEAPAEPALSVEEVVAAQAFSEEYLADAANFEAGKEFWFAQCTHCHGFKAYPGKAPKLKPAKYKPEFVFKRVYKGFKKMPAWRETFSIDEIRQIVAYVKAPGFSP